MSNNKDLFTSGQISKVYKNFQKNNFEASDFTWILGSLCLLGKKDEAFAFSRKQKLESEHYFFMALAEIRASEFTAAKKLIEKLRKLKSKNKFFEYQIMAIYAYYKSRYKCCLQIVKRSRAESLNLENAFWKVLAIDLLGHTHVMMGEVHKGITLLEEAHDLAATIKNIAFQQATKISILNYQSQYTDNPHSMITKIERKLKSISRQDNYSEASLILSLSHLYLVSGLMEKAFKVLQQSQKIIFASSSPRQKCKWFFEKSYYYYLAGKFDMALDHLNEAIKLINTEFEISTSLKILGLKRSIYAHLKKDTSEIDRALVQLTLKVGDPQAINKLARLKLITPEKTEDPLQIMFDDFIVNKISSEVIEAGYFGVLRPYLLKKNSNQDQSFFIEGIWKNGLLIITSKFVLAKKFGVSSLLINALALLSKKKSITKEEIVLALWGYDYDPLRHDTLIYGLIHRLRDILGPLEKDLKGENHQYFFSHSFKHIELSELDFKTLSTVNIPEEKLQESFHKRQIWNIRQHKALGLMSRGQTFKVSEYAEAFNVTTMTALRDLSELLKANQISVYGKARATTYAL